MIFIIKKKWFREQCEGCKSFNPECRLGVCCLEVKRGSKPHSFLHLSDMSKALFDTS